MKAKNILKETLMGNCSDPPNTPMFMHQLNKHGEPKKDSMGLFLCHSIRRTNLTKLRHKTLASICGTWKMGIEFSDCILTERNHRYNQRMSESKRDNYPKFGHYDSWMVDLLQMLVLENHSAC